jgi:hypothetical protein
MKFGKIGVIILIVFTLRLSISCCDCPPTTTYNYNLDKIEIFHIDNSGQTPVIVNSGIIPKEAYGLQIECSLEQLALQKSSVFASFNSIYAYDCFCPPEIQYVAQDTISSIKIISLDEFDSYHPANSDISEYFKVLSSKNYITIRQYLDYPETIFLVMPEQEVISLYLMQPPIITGEHQFLVEIGLESGTTLTATSTLINLE